MRFTKEKLRQLSVEDFGDPDVPATFRRKARLMAKELNISMRDALEIVRKEDRQRLTKLEREHAKTIKKIMAKPVKVRNYSGPKREKKSKWPELPQNVVSPFGLRGGAVSLGKRR